MTTMRAFLTIAAVTAAATLTGGCSSESGGCEAAMRQAADVSDTQDQLSDLDNAIVLCSTLEDFEAASDKHPDALDGVDAELMLSNYCVTSESGAVRRSELCAAVLGG